MKSLVLSLITVIMATAVFAPGASADSIQVSSGLIGPTILASGSGTINFSGVFAGWTIFITSGTSNSPGLLPFGLDLTTLASCSSGDCLTNPLNMFLSDTGFATPVSAGNFQTSDSVVVTGPGSTSEIAWANSSNTLFALGLANKIGSTLGTFTSPGGFGTTSGGPAESGPYSLTIEQIFNANGGASSFSADSNITATTPEPASLSLLGAGLLSLVLLRRKIPRLIYMQRG